MAYKSDNYTPNGKSRAILDRAWEHVKSVPYQVTARWLFYRLLQDGLYDGKADYKNGFLPLLSRARHNDYSGWRPDTLADDQREAIVRGDGWATPAGWARAMAATAVCELARWDGQEHYVEVWFEAGAMRSQFEHYTHDLTLRPFLGMPSIPYKWQMAKALEAADRDYGLPAVVLYFGDLDPAGMVIPETTINDVRGWCDVAFDVVRCGLNEGDQARYNLPENPEKPGAYQWEALPDQAAGGLIRGSVAQYVDFAAMAQIADLEGKVTAAFREYARGFSFEAQG